MPRHKMVYLKSTQGFQAQVIRLFSRWGNRKMDIIENGRIQREIKDVVPALSLEYIQKPTGIFEFTRLKFASSRH